MFLLEAFEGNTLLRVRLLFELLKGALDVLYMLAGLLEVLLKSALELVVLDLGDQLGQRLLGEPRST